MLLTHGHSWFYYFISGSGSGPGSGFGPVLDMYLLATESSGAMPMSDPVSVSKSTVEEFKDLICVAYL